MKIPTSNQKSNSLFHHLPIELRNRPIVSEPVFIKSVLPHNFRGFRNGSVPIQFDSKLVIIEGRNSQGKTSLVEALEWLLTGSLSRRDSKDLGDSKELENCISISFRPHEENTWVEAVFVKNEEIIKLKRILIKDYGKTRNDSCSSILYKNSIELTIQEESELKEQLFGLVPPILMQHTLGDFVKNNPSLKSYLLRVPNSFNSKCVTRGLARDQTKVKVVSQWNYRIPSIGNLIGSFYAYLISEKIRSETKRRVLALPNTKYSSNEIKWIEKLLQTPLEDYRKYCIFHILVPYLVNVKELSTEKLLQIIVNWLSKCNTVNPLDFDPSTEIKNRIKYVRDFKPMSLAKLRKDNHNLYQLLTA